jgi:hypothetical protein
MSRVYDSLRVRVHDTLQRGKVPLARIKSGSALGLIGEMDDLERMVAERIGKMKAALKEGETAAADEALQTEQLLEGLKASVTTLEAKLVETQEAITRRDSSHQQTEETLNAKIHDLESDAKKKEEDLASRDSEISDIKSKLDGQVKQIGELELAIEQARQEAARHVKRAEHLAESSRTSIAVLESQLKEKEELVRQKDSTIRDLDEKLNAQIQEFESLMKDKEALLAGRNSVINDLRSQLNVLTNGIGQMSSFFKQTEVLAGIAVQAGGAAVVDNGVEAKQETTVPPQPEIAKAPPVVPEAVRETLSPEIFQHIASELAEAAGVMSVLASLIVRQHVVALGESMDNFPRARLAELLERVAKEIADEKRQIDFRERLSRNAEINPN